MRITSIELKLASRFDDHRLKAYCTVIFDNDYIVHDLKIIQGDKGLFLVMPSRRWGSACTKCRSRNVISNFFCGHCGYKLPNKEERLIGIETHNNGKPKIYLDIFHPINNKAKQELNDACLNAYHEVNDADVLCSEPDEEQIVETLESRHE